MTDWLRRLLNNHAMSTIITLLLCMGVSLSVIVYASLERNRLLETAELELQRTLQQSTDIVAKSIVEADRTLFSSQQLLLSEFYSFREESQVQEHLKAIVSQSPEVMGIGLYNIHGDPIHHTKFFHSLDISAIIPKIITKHQESWSNPLVHSLNTLGSLLNPDEILISRKLFDETGLDIGFGLALINLSDYLPYLKNDLERQEISIEILSSNDEKLIDTAPTSSHYKLMQSPGQDLFDETQRHDGMILVKADANNYPIYGVSSRKIENVLLNWNKRAFLYAGGALLSILLITAVQHLYRKITAIEKIQQLENERHSQVLNSFSAIPYELELNNRTFTYVGPQFEAILGWPIGKLTHLSDWENLLHPEERDFIIEERNKAFETTSDASLEYRLLNAHGEYVWLQSNMSVTEQPDGKVARGILTDISQLKSLQDRLVDQIHQTEAANKSKSVFLANMSHEIRTPMVGIKGIIELLKNDDSLYASHQQLLDDLESSSDTLLSLLNDVLDISKIEAGKLSISENPVFLAKHIDSIGHLFKSAAHNKHLKLTLDNQIPTDCVCLVDVLRLRQILSNLIGNAVKFTHQGTIHISAKVDLEDHPNKLMVSVADSGIGLSKDQQVHIFQAFTQGDASTTKEYGGTGLGLTISSKLAELMNGEIDLKSELGIGSVFTLILPIRLSEIDSYEAEEESELPSLNILLAEDNVINQKVVQAMLVKNGHTVSVASNGQEAIIQARQTKFDAILMDMHMPELDGEEATKIIKSRIDLNKDTPVFAFTADAVKENRERFIQAGVSDVIIKPVKWETMKHVLSHVLLHRDEA